MLTLILSIAMATGSSTKVKVEAVSSSCKVKTTIGDVLKIEKSESAMSAKLGELPTMTGKEYRGGRFRLKAKTEGKKYSFAGKRTGKKLSAKLVIQHTKGDASCTETFSVLN